jgi:alpha-L-fucosidase 2
MEWPNEYEEIEIGHRHISHLFALYPSDEITVEHTPRLAEAARKTLYRRLSYGGGHTGWSCAWIINMWARLQDSENALKYVKMILAQSTYPNLFDAHPPFQIDGNFGAAAGITEMLLQSHKGVLHLLPALPDSWSQGHIRGVRARGNYEIDIEWYKGQLVKAVIRTGNTIPLNVDGQSSIMLKYKKLAGFTVRCNGSLLSYDIKNDVIKFDARPSEEYVIQRDK